MPLYTIKCDHPACGNMQERGMTADALKAAETTEFRNVPPCPRCGRRFSFRLATDNERKEARMLSK